MANKANGKFSGCVMRGDLEVAEIKDDEIVAMEKSAPLYLQRRKDFAGWIGDRGADINRSNMRIILRQLGFPLQDIKKAVRYVHAASVTDSFWIRLVSDFVAVRKKIRGRYALPKLTVGMIGEVYREVKEEYPVDVGLAAVSDFCMNAYAQLSTGCEI